MVGLGALGLPIAINLRRAGYRLNVHTRSRSAESAAELVDDQGPTVTCSSSPDEATDGCGVLLICVSDDSAVQNVLWGENGAGFALKPGSLVIDCSTIAPATAAAMAKRLQSELSSRGALTENWLLAHLKRNEFWVRKAHIQAVRPRIGLSRTTALSWR